MFKGRKGFITGAAVILVVSITACAAFASVGEQKTIDSVSEVKALHIDTRYVPLPDINSEKVVEHKIHDNQIIINGVISSNTQGYARVLQQNPEAILLVDEKGTYIAVGRIERNGGYSDICITKYDSNGRELKRQTYGGSDFDWANAAKYNPQIGIVISGISQSSDGDFANKSNSPFVACINPETLEVRWISSVQIADWVFHVSDEAVYIVRNEGEKYNGKGELKLSIVKFDGEGNKIWATEPLSQWICGITELKDGRVIGIQKLSDHQAVEKSGAINCYSKDGGKLLTFEADCYGDIEPTNDGGFFVVSVRNIKTIPQPLYISSIWYDTETVVTKYDKNYKIEWRKTYDRIKDAIGVDSVLPLSDGSVALEE
ncbi:MAG: hypothetical protein PHC91_03800 [Eubacteriales bacterium]|nr:hypothetical protein [Eubacteriales bacterium]